jgi:threonylcarbamoyladenosine tRNA methylthiotransferase MtaB
MATFHIVNFGCRATQADAAAIERQLLDRGYAAAESPDAAEVIVVNTCTVTASADTQARQAIRTIHRENPAANILVTGCYAQRAPEDLASLDGVRWVVGNSHKTEIPRLLEQEQPARAASGGLFYFPLSRLNPDSMSLEHGPAKILTGNIFEQMEIIAAPVLGGEAGHTRPVLKIQDGCDNRCSYCVIPFVRGHSRSLQPAQVVTEICRLVLAGAREVVLSGINLGSYGRDLVPRAEFGDLLRRIRDETSLERFRISSIEPMDVTRDLIELFAASDRLAPHFHVPLQSGSDRILAAMHRWYRTSHYARHIELIRELLPNAGVGADVIAGFPGETEDDHCATLALMQQLPFTYLHVFSFSPRPGTKAAGLWGEVPLDVIQRRARELRAVSAAKSAAFRAAQLGRRHRVLTLHRSGKDADGNWTGAIAGNYLNVRVSGSWPANHWLDVEINSVDGTHALGRVIPQPKD